MNEENNMLYHAVARQINLLNEGNSSAKAALAKLRHGAGKSPGSIPDLWKITIEPLPEALRGKTEASYGEWAFHTALTLFAVHRQGNEISGRKQASFGAAVRLLKDGANDEAITRRFNETATAGSFLELAHHARGLVQLLHSKGVDMDYPQFAVDLYEYQFDEGRDRIRMKWGRDFYAYHGEKEMEKADEE